MKTRDRLFLMIVVAGVLLGAAYLKVVSPERQQAATLVTQVSTAQSALQTAQASVVTARAAKNKYPAAYAAVLNLGKAVPPESDTASLIYQVNSASSSRHVSFDSITAGGTNAAPTAAAPAGAAPAAFTTLPFTFQFSGTFFDLYRLLDRLNQFTEQTTDGNVQVSGRLLTIQGATLTGDQHSLSGTITANAYVMAPPAAPSAAPATPGAPSTTAPATSATPGAAPAVIHP